MTSAQDPIVNIEDAEALLGSLAGVVSAHVVADATGEIVEIHILSGADLHPKQMVRNGESALSAGLGLQIDRRIVSVAQIRADIDANGHRPHPTPVPDDDDADPDPDYEVAAPRLEFVRYQAQRDAEQCTCDVVLRAGDREVQGSGNGPDTTAGRAQAAARAVFQGIEQARPDVQIELEDTLISRSGGHSYIIVAAHAVLERSTVPLAGAATLTRSPEEAAILAALQATNRWSA